MQLVHHIINYRLTIITEAENLIVPGQDGGRAGRGVDLNQLKLDWVTSEAKRLKQRIIRIDIDFKNAFNSMSQTALWAVMRAYNIPDVDLLEVIYGRTTACMDSDDAECAIITFLTGVIQGGALPWVSWRTTGTCRRCAGSRTCRVQGSMRSSSPSSTHARTCPVAVARPAESLCPDEHKQGGCSVRVCLIVIYYSTLTVPAS
jgi:hypothetical protein